ncbi:ACT domain-containing protein [Pararhodobacter sp.]|uniref:ACT domain-containing protein n=1 Tax=Pararhodobacter sp. TaxID=2127056 RepID=UPI002AFFDA94|nr:ACT domain-containing protein [Pararhodobacter sp.]
MAPPTVLRTRAEMLRQMRPERVAGRFMFQSIPEEDLADRMSAIQGLFRESEGISVIVPAEPGAAGAMAQITLQAYSALDGVGLTAAVSGALAQAGIACNMVAALNHDHVFVPEADADRALKILRDVSRFSKQTDQKG